VATNDQFIKAKPKLMHGFMRALLKALRLVKQNREVAMGAMMKFSGLDREGNWPRVEPSEALERLERLERFSPWSTKKRRKTISTSFDPYDPIKNCLPGRTTLRLGSFRNFLP
jgi:hypothetical protein